jgi:putative membrane protein insertion efficiency factor
MATEAFAAASHPGPVARLLLGAIRLYQLLFSPMYSGSCRFVPSCSQYAAEAVRKFGAARGSWLALRRLARCHPLGSSGADPVPD